ncbi:3-dehydrosphinganine reductase TSC10A [Senna tora]|uniref:3-dehydrosphinganine reductase n=1 Tax=Senna tora TaxID=362788 RepID=A0A834T4S8_9FABA|nr:3-dehydrosphinganine reductase TSC10A [Senna tora]
MPCHHKFHPFSAFPIIHPLPLPAAQQSKIFFIPNPENVMASFFFVLFSLFVLLSIPLLVFLYFIARPRPVKIPLKNRHVFITGGSSGIGLALAHQAAAEGARVSILARSIDKLDEARTSIRLSTGIDVSVFSADVRDYDALKRAVDEAGPIDVLIANHGVFWATELEKQELFGIKFMVDVNLMGSFNLVKAALPAMKNRPKDRGPASIALMSSQAGQVGIYGYTAYSASKFGLRGLAEALQHEVVADDIYVSLIFPPDTDTPGLLEENKKKPQITSLIVASSGLMKANEVAKKALNGIKSGSFIIPCNFEGYMLALATAGLSPQGSFLMAFIECAVHALVKVQTIPQGAEALPMPFSETSEQILGYAFSSPFNAEIMINENLLDQFLGFYSSMTMKFVKFIVLAKGVVGRKGRKCLQWKCGLIFSLCTW